MSCATFEALVDYWAGDLEAEAQADLEAHLFGCVACTARSAQVATVTETIRGLVPPLLSPGHLAALRARGTPVVENPMAPGERKQVHVPARGVLVHRLGGLDLQDATRVSFTLTAEGTDHVLVALSDAPFDRARGEVLLACQAHFKAMPHDTVAEVRVERGGAEARVERYTILHLYP